MDSLEDPGKFEFVGDYPSAPAAEAGSHLSPQDTVRNYRLSTLVNDTLAGVQRALSAQPYVERALNETTAEHDGFETDTSLMGPDDRLELSVFAVGAGLPDEELLGAAAQLAPGESFSRSLGDGLSIKIKRLGPLAGAISYKIVVDATVDISARQAALEAFRSTALLRLAKMGRAKQQVADGLQADGRAAFSDETFSLASEADGTLSFLATLGVRVDGGLSAARPSDVDGMRRSAIGYLANVPSYINESDGIESDGLHEGIYYNSAGIVQQMVVATYRPGVYVCLRNINSTALDIESADFRVGVQIVPHELYREADYNRRMHEGTTPFIETPTAAALLQAFADAGIEPNARIIDSFAEVGTLNKRYGHGFADICREVAKLVDDRGRSLGKFFVDSEGLSERIAAIPHQEDSAAEALLSLLRGVVRRDAVPTLDMPELPMSSTLIKMRDGSCKDAEVYLADSDQESIIADASGQPLLIRSPYSRPTGMTLRPVVLNGVRLPAGSLLAIEPDGYVLMRLTGYAFEPEVAAVVFGPQDAENRLAPNYNQRRLDHLVHR